MIELKITDPAKMDKNELRTVANFLLSFAGVSVNSTVETTIAQVGDKSLTKTKISTAVVEPADNPATGAPTASDAAQVFAAPIEQTVAFGEAGNVPAVDTQPTVSQPANVTAHVSNTNSAPVSGDVDADGLPWDSRIHASSKTKNADGRWRGRRGVDDAVVNSVTAELRQVMSIPAPNPLAAFPTASQLGMVHAPEVVANPFVPPAPLANDAAAAFGSQEPAAVQQPAGMDYATFIGLVTAGLTAIPPTLQQPVLQQILAKYGVSGLPLLAARQDLIPAIAAELGLA